MNKIIQTNENNWTALFARIAIAVVIFPHGAQKLLGWFGGNGFEGTMQYFTTGANLPWIIAFMVIVIEFFCSLFLLFGFMTRIAALGILANFIGVVLFAHGSNGFFMNWGMAAGQPEGIEYFILLFGLGIISLIAGGGKGSIDAKLSGRNIQPKLA
ncbi:MAG: DoxX family protein [Bacteroidetes bacterium]|nr:DoxX family protein [Bacteroidota bacterium]